MSDDNELNININANPSGVEGGARRAKAAVGSVSKETAELDAAFRRLKSSIDPTFAATERYNKALADNQKLLDAQRISQDEFAAGARAAKLALDQQIASIEKSSSAARAAAAEIKRQKQEEAQATRAAAQEAVAIARAKAAADRMMSQQAKAELKQRQAEEKASIREAAALARAAAQEKVAAERQANREIKADVRAAKEEEKRLIREAAVAARTAAQQKAAAEKAASKESAAAERQAKQEAKQAAQDAASAAKAAAREKLAAERQASKDAAEAEKQAKREATAAARQATQDAAAAIKAKNAAERDSARLAREAATAAQDQARAERQSAAALQELRASIDPAFAAQSRYNETMRRATQLLMENKLQAGEWVIIQKQARSQMDLNTRSLGRMNSVYVQMGYQTQDVVASIASGINPLVILAQQGGQTAAALSMMGGTVGRVAAFFAGPWGAAIIGATLLLGLFLGANKKAEKGTIDVMDAESRRTAKLKDLTEALKKFTEEQRKANESTDEQHRLSNQAMMDASAEVEMKKAGIEALLTEAKARLDEAMKTPNSPGPILFYTARIAMLERSLKGLKTQTEATNAALKETQITQAEDRAEAKVDPMKQIALEYSQKEVVLQQKFRQGVIDQITLEKELVKIKQQKKDAEDAYHKSQKQSKENTQEQVRYEMPVNGPITSGFGHRDTFKTANGNMASTNHAGIDIGAAAGTAVKAPQVGVVESVGFSPTLGKYIVISHGAGVTTRYGHLAEQDVQKGDRVSQGQKIGEVGQTGNATGPHLHYEVRINGKPVDPKKGFFPIDQLKAEGDAAKSAFEEQIASYNEEIAAADDNYNKALEIQDKKIAATKEYYGEDSKEAHDAMKERIALEHKLQDQLLNEHRKGIQARAVADQQAEDMRANAAGTKLGMQSDVVDFKESTGMLNEKQVVAAHAAIMEQEYQEAVNHENRMFELKRQSMLDQLALENLPVKVQQEINAQIEEAEAQHQARMTAIQNQHARDAAQVQLQTANVSMQRWRGVVQTFTQGLSTAFQGLWMRTTSIRDAVLGIADQLVFKFADMGITMLEHWIMNQLGMQTATAASQATQTAVVVGAQATQTTAVATGTAARVGIEAAGAATSKGISIGTALTDIGAAAARGAANTYAAISAIPVIGPFLAPAMAVGALAAILGFAGKMFSAEGGWGDVPKDGMNTQLHKKEMVLPAKFAVPLRKQLTTRNSSGMFANATQSGTAARQETNNRKGDTNFFYQPKHEHRPLSLMEALNKDASDFRRWMRNEVRNGGLKGVL